MKASCEAHLRVARILLEVFVGFRERVVELACGDQFVDGRLAGLLRCLQRCGRRRIDDGLCPGGEREQRAREAEGNAGKRQRAGAASGSSDRAVCAEQARCGRQK